MNFFKRTLVALALIFGVFTLSSCNKQENEILFIKAGNPDGKISIGELNGNTYTNSYFGLSITFPENLYPLDNEQKLKMIEVDTKIINKGFDSDDLLKNVKDMIPLAVAYDKVEVLKNDNVASFVMMAQKIDDSNKDILSSASEYLRTMEKGFKEIVGFNLDYTLNILEPIIINEKEFQTMHIEFDFSDLRYIYDDSYGLYMYEDVYVIYVNGYAVFLVTMYYNDEQKAKILQVVNSISFN